MPTYQYSCNDCGHFFETFQSFTDDSLTVCPECEGRLRKVFNAVGVVFKGSGFYRNDSRQKAGAEVGAGKGSKESSEKSSGKGSPESKPAAKSEGSSGSSSGSSSTSAAAAPA